MSRTLTPISEAERIEEIDIIRGIAIFGIFAVNMGAFNFPWLYMSPGEIWNSPWDLAVERFIDIFFQANFYPLFSFLFGFGLIIFQERAESKGYTFAVLYRRRLLILLGIGMIHAFLIWHGDILIPYALTGFLLIPFHQMETKNLLSWSLGLILIPSVLLGSLLLLVNFTDPAAETYRTTNEAMAEQSMEIYRYGTFAEITVQRIQDWYYVNNLSGFIFIALSILPMFLLGAYVAKKRWFHEPDRHAETIKQVWRISLCIALPFKILPYLWEQYDALQFLQDTLGGHAAAIFYAFSLILLLRRESWRKRLAPLGRVGRLSLSNYLLQSLLSTMLFYSYGLGLYGTISPSLGFALTLLIFAVQIVLSHYWLRYYSIGPAEWVWRSLTYGKKQQLRSR